MTVLRKAAVILLLLLGTQLALAGPVDDLVNRVKNSLKKGDIKSVLAPVDSALAVTPNEFKLLRLKGDICVAQTASDSALYYYGQALNQKPKDPDALYGAGMAAFRVQQSQRALEYFERGVQTKKRKAEFLYGLGLAQMQLGSLSEADVSMRKAIKADGKNPNYHKALGDINFKKEVWSLAISEYKIALSLDSTRGELYNLLARAQFQSRMFEEAIQNFKTYLKYVPDDSAAWHDVARIFDASKNYAEAAFCYQKLTEIYPRVGDFWFGLGQSQYNLKEYEKAGIALEKAVSLNTKVAESYKMLAKIYQLRKEYYKADSAYSRFEQELGPPNEVDYWLDKGKVMVNIGKTDPAFLNRAIEAFDTAIKIDSANASAWEFAGLTRYYKEDYAGAIPYFEKKVQLEGAQVSVNTLRNLAFCYLKVENYAKSAQTLEEAIRLKPEDAVIQQMLGNIYKFRGAVDTSLFRKGAEHLKLALKDTTGTISNPDKCKIRGDIGYCYVMLRDCQNAIPYLEIAVECDSRNENVLLSMAQAYHLCNEIKKANTYYKKVLEINPKNQAAIEGELRTHPR